MLKTIAKTKFSCGKISFILLLFCISTSCTVQRFYTTLDVLRPGAITFAKDASNLLVLNNTVTQPANYGTTIQVANKKATPITQNFDSVAYFTLLATTEDLGYIGFFNSLTLLQDSQNKTDKFFQITRLKSTEIDELCQIYNADVALVLNRVAANSAISTYYLENENKYLAALDIKTISNWSVHYPDTTACESVNLVDSLFWEEIDYDIEQAVKRLPNSDAIIDAAIYAGKRACQRLLPRWEKVDRTFYKNKNKLIVQGMEEVYRKSWETAIQTWKIAATQEKNKTTKAIAYANMGVASEIIGDIDNAIKYVNEAAFIFATSLNLNSYEFYYQQNAYLEELVIRQRELKLLEKQL